MAAIQIVNSLPQDKWLEFVEKHPAGNIFHLRAMLEVFREARKHETALFAAIEAESREILSLLLSTEIRVLGMPIGRLNSRSIIYGGILCKESDEGKDSLIPLLDIYNQSIKNRALFTEIRNMSPIEGIREQIEKCGYKYINYLNYLIDLKRPPDTIFQSFSKSGRRNLKKSQREGVLVEEIANKGKIQAFYELIKKTYSKVKVPVADISLFESAFDKLHPHGMVKFFLATQGNKYIGARVVLLFKSQIFDWYAGADEDFLGYYPNEKLVWHILKWGSESGFDSFDFGGAGRPEEKYGVRDFKERFGGQLVDHGRYVKVHSPNLYKLAETGYQIYRKIL